MKCHLIFYCFSGVLLAVSTQPFVLRSFFVTARIRVGLGLAGVSVSPSHLESFSAAHQVMSRHDQGHWSWSGVVVFLLEAEGASRRGFAIAGNKYRSASGALNQLKKKTQKAEEERKQEKEESEKVLHSFAAANALLKQRETELLSENSQLKALC